jgi:hypothetical protein
MHYSMGQRINMLKRGSFFLAAPTFEQLTSMSLKGLEESWGALNWVKDRDYVMFKTPPLGFEKPYAAPEEWKHCIAHRSGGYIQLLSGDRVNTRRGGSFDGGDADEVGWLKATFFEDVISPSLRGNIEYFKDNPLWQVVRLFTSMPRDSDGQWIFEFEEKYKLELAEKGFNEEFMWTEGNVYDNIEIWGEKGIEKMRKRMPLLKFEVEALNRRIKKAERPFYHKFNPNYHAKPFKMDYYIDKVTGIMKKGLKDLRRDMPVDVSFDFGGWFTCCTVSQYHEDTNKELTFHEFFRDGEDMLRPVVQDTCTWLDKQGLRIRKVNVYGEPRGQDPRADGKKMYVKAIQYFNEMKYEAETFIDEGKKTEEHEFRFEVMNEIFAETNENYPVIEINEDGCPCLCVVLESTGVKNDYHKDKSKERDRDFAQQYAPHLSDTIDYKVMQKHFTAIQYSSRPSAAGTA